MQTFYQWLSTVDLLARLRLLKTYVGFDPKQYNALFDGELERLLARVSDPGHRAALEGMRGFGWMAYISTAVRRAGFQDRRAVDSGLMTSP